MRVLFTALLTLCVTAIQAQFLAPGNFDPAPDGYCVSIEEITSHHSGELAGQTTYRLYLNCLNPSDYLGGCAGDANNPLIIESTSGDWYNNPFNSSWNASSISEAIVGVFPEVVYDSYLTIGADNAATTAAGMSTIWGDIDASLEFTGGDAGQNVTVNDVTGGAWYEPFEGVEANQTGLAGDDLKIMFAQITTSGTLSGQVYFSVYMNGDQEQEWRDVLAFDSCPILGCTDSTACNYDVEATEDDGSCAELDCAGVCGGDAVLDACDICNGPGAVYECGCADIAEGACDCDGNVLDECGFCGGEGIADGACDCDGNVLDECGICGGDGIAEGECNCAGDVEDECGVCGGEGIADGACDCDGNVLDECGVCGGEGIADGACDCEGNVLDECGVCGGEGIAEGACDCSGNVLDECGVCGGEGIADGACDCEGNVLDECGVCGGDGIAEGECNCDGDVEDECGVCGGDGIPDGACDCDGSVLDECGVCGGEGIADGACDCDGNVLDECGVCGGEGIADGACDCDGNVLDECGNCGGDGAGTPVNDDCDGALMIGCGMTVEGSTLCASVSNNPCVNGRKGVWYTFEGIGAEVGLSLCSFGAVEENEYDTRLLLFSGGCDALHCEVNNDDFFGQNLPNGVPWACAETSNGLNSGIGFFSEAGVTYHIMVTSFASQQTGDYEFTLSCDMMEDCCETELTWNQELSDAIVECVEDLPMTCEDFTTGLMAINECDESEYEAVCTPLLSLDNQEVSSGVATTAKRNESLGEDEYDYSDAAIRLYGLSASGIADSDYFVEDPSAPLSWNYYPESGTATLTGRVYCRENSARWFDLNAAFEDALNAQDWMDLDSDNTLLVNTDPNNPGATCDYDAENMTVFLMQPGSSYLLADGESNELNGLIGLDHMPLSLNKRFQYGPQANNHNCGYGLGGWFRWDGILNGEEVSGFSGDIVVDIEESSNDASCSESACFDYTALDFGCGRALTERFCVNREDTTPPLITEGPLDVTVECDAVPEMAGTDAIVANDNCSGDLSYAEGTELRIDGDCPSNYVLIRKWDVTDACGLTSTWTQNIQIQDTSSPTLTSEAAGETVECDGEGNLQQLSDWIDSNGGATASDNCGQVTWSNDYSLCDGDDGSFNSYKQHDWGGNSTVASDLMDANFDAVFPDGVAVGCDDLSLRFTSSAAVDTYLPCTGIAEDLVLTHGGDNPTENAIDPTCWNNALVSHLLTAKLNVAFDNAFEDFSPSSISFGDLLVSSGAFDGMSVHEVIQISDEVLGDCNNDFSPSQCRSTLRNINRNYSPSENDWGDLIIPGCWTAGCGSTGMAVVTFTAEDECGNSSSSTATFSIVDTTSPEIVADSNIMVDCEAYSIDFEHATSSDVCGSASLTWVDAQASGGCITPIGAYMRTYTSVDACGNTSIFEQAIVLTDNAAPEIEMPAEDAVVECDGEGNLLELNLWLESNGGAVATDNCSNFSWTNDFDLVNIVAECELTGSVDVTFRVIDDCGNEAQTMATFTVVDTTVPEFDFVPADATYECDEDIIYNDATATDVCSEPTITVEVDTVAGSCPHNFTIYRSFTATDACGLFVSQTQTITVQDTTDPVLTAEAMSSIVECDGAGNQEAFNAWLNGSGGATATDNCGTLTWDNDFSGELQDPCGASGYVDVTFTATDDCGNNVSTSARFTIEDTTDPVFDPFMSTIMVECTEGDYSSPDYQPLTATDHCSGVEYDIQSVCMSGGCLWTVMRIWTATDDCGNSTTVEQFIMLIDTTAPVVTAPAPYNVDADADDCSADISATADVAGFATVQDNCGDVDCWGMESITVWSEDAELEAICGYGMDDQGSRSIVRTWYAQDRCGNIGQDTQIITISDVTPPMASVTDESVACADYDPTMEYGMTMSSDNCAAQPTYTWENTETIQGDCAGSYMVMRTYTFVDDCENTVDVVQTITVFDDVAPVISGENQVDVECSSDYANTVFITASDACGSGAEISFSDVPVSGGCVQPVGMYQRMYSVTDDCGNVATFEQFVRLLDTTAPELTIPEDYTIECDQDIVYDDASATDNCDGSVAMGYSEEVVAGDCPQSYEIKRTFTATDDCDNSVSATQTITVQDTTAPELTVPEDYTAECSDVHPLEDASATDNCGMVSIAMDADTVAGACAQSYVVTRTFTASDECGNETTLSQTITIEDTTAPLFNEALPGDMTAECDDVPEASVLTAMDNCQDDVTVSYSESRSDGDCPSNYTLTRVWSVSDDCDNVTDHTQVLTIQDTTAPELSIPADYTAECSDEHPLEDASATDNCGEVSIVMDADTAAGACDQAYVVTRTFTASDVCGNETTLSQTIVIEDTTSPEISADTEAFVACSDYDVNVAYATTTDNCGMVDLSWTDAPVSGGCVLPIGQYVRNYTATDECGNASTFEQILTLTDEVDPEFTSVPEGATYECFEEIEYLDATATDNCSGATVGVVADTVFSNDCMQTFTITRTFTATDNCGNSATATQVIEVQDTEGPDFTFVPEDYTAECSDELTLADAMATDHCSMVNIEVNTIEIPGTCEGHYTMLREFVATDDCGNQASQTQVITIQDTTAPELSIPGDYTAECSDEHPLEEASATDNCSMVSIVMDADTAAGACAQSYVVTRTFIATDECGNSTSLSQVITIQDTTAPELTIPADYIAECDEELVFDDASASDNCGTSSIVLEETTNETDCAQEYSIVRTFTATDECGNSSVASQTITVVDTTDPVIASAGGLMNGQVVEVCCESLEGGITVPEAVELVYSDNCDDAANLDYNEECIGGNCPTVDVESWCEVSNPAVMPDGETCDNYSVHSMRLFNFPGSEFYTTIEGRVANNVDGTKTYTMTVVSSDNDAAGWEITNNYSAPMSWEDWIAQPGSQSYKSDCGLGDHTEWMYTMLTSGSATGWGDYAGSSLTFNHQPASGYFGFQIGEGANNKNGNYGFSAWMYYNGIFDGSPVSGSGDVFGDLDCCLPYDLSRNYVVTDCAGNDTEFGYTVRMTGEDCASGDAGDISVPEDSDLTFVKDLVKIASLQPNPTSDMSTLVLTTEEPSLQVEVAVMTMTGSTVMTLYNGPVVAGWPTIIEVPAFQLESGMYQVKARAKTYVTTKKLLVAN